MPIAGWARKTMLLERFRRAHPAIYDRGERRLISPVLALQMASHATVRRFYGQLLTAIGVPFVPRATVLEMEIQALRNLRRIEVRLLMLEQRGHAVGMCGDGANDAPALRQAQMGIVVSTATDLAKAAAGIVLTDPGLSGIVTCIKEGRSAFQRVLTYTLSILVNKSATLIVMAAGLVMTGHAVLTPLLQALSMLAGDLVTMSRAADRARPTSYPNRWRIRNLILAAIPLGVFKLSYCLSVLAVGWYLLHLNRGQMQALTFLMLVLAGQANVYVLREREHFWKSHPAWVMLIAPSADVAIVTSVAAGGVLMTPLTPAIIGMLFMTTVAFANSIKIMVRTRLRID